MHSSNPSFCLGTKEIKYYLLLLVYLKIKKVNTLLLQQSVQVTKTVSFVQSPHHCGFVHKFFFFKEVGQI